MSFGRISSLVEIAMLEEIVKTITDNSTSVHAYLDRTGHVVLELNDKPHTQLTLEVKR